MSLDARFTELRRGVGDGWRGGGGASMRLRGGRIARPRQHINSVKNRLLAMQMADRPTVMAALRRSRPRGRGGGDYMNGRARSRTRSPFPNRRRSRSRSRPDFFSNSPDFRARSITPTRFRRSNSLGRMTRSQSMQSLASVGHMSLASDREMFKPRTFRGRLFTRTRGNRISPRGGIVKLRRQDRLGLQTSPRGGLRTARGRGFASVSRLTGRIGLKNDLVSPRRGRGGLRGALRGALRGVRGSVRGVRGSLRGAQGSVRGAQGSVRGVQGSVRGVRGARGNLRGNTRGSPRGGARGRGGRADGRGRGIGRGGGRGRGGRGRGRGGKPPTREDLDKELDSYMASTKTYLDRELDQYMSQPTTAATA